MPPGAELDLLAVDQDEPAVAGQGAVGDDEVQGVGFAAAGFAAEQHVAFGQVDVDGLAVLVDAQVHGAEDGQREHRHRSGGDGGGHGRDLLREMTGRRQAPGGPGALPFRTGGSWAGAARSLGWAPQVAPGAERGKRRCHRLAGREGVAADDVDGHRCDHLALWVTRASRA